MLDEEQKRTISPQQLIQYQLEKASVLLQYFNHKEAKNALDKALELAGIRIELGGALGKTIRIFRLLSLIVRLFERDDQGPIQISERETINEKANFVYHFVCVSRSTIKLICIGAERNRQTRNEKRNDKN